MTTITERIDELISRAAGYQITSIVITPSQQARLQAMQAVSESETGEMLYRGYPIHTESDLDDYPQIRASVRVNYGGGRTVELRNMGITETVRLDTALSTLARTASQDVGVTTSNTTTQRNPLPIWSREYQGRVAEAAEELEEDVNQAIVDGAEEEGYLYRSRIAQACRNVRFPKKDYVSPLDVEESLYE